MGYRKEHSKHYVEDGNNSETLKTITRTSRNGKWQSRKCLNKIMVYGTHTPYSTGVKVIRTVTNLETGEFWTDRYGSKMYFESYTAFKVDVLTRARLMKECRG